MFGFILTGPYVGQMWCLTVLMQEITGHMRRAVSGIKGRDK